MLIELFLFNYLPDASQHSCTYPDDMKKLTGTDKTHESFLHCNEPRGVFGAESMNLQR